MTELTGAYLLLATPLLYLLHALWTVVASGRGTVAACFVAGYLGVALLFRSALPSLVMVPVWLPLLYPYAWLGLAALLWSLPTLRVSRHGLAFPGEPSRVAACFLAVLLLHVGVLLFSPVLYGRPLAAYMLLPPFVAPCCYLLYRAVLSHFRRNGSPRLGWLPLLGLTVLGPVLLAMSAQYLVPISLKLF